MTHHYEEMDKTVDFPHATTYSSLVVSHAAIEWSRNQILDSFVHGFITCSEAPGARSSLILRPLMLVTIQPTEKIREPIEINLANAALPSN